MQFIWEHRETMHHILSACKKIVETEYVKRHNNILKQLAVKMGCGKWAAPWRYKIAYNKFGTWKCYWKMEINSPGTGDIQWERTALHVDKTLHWRTNKYNKDAKRDGKIWKYHRLCFELQNRQKGYIAKVIPKISG